MMKILELRHHKDDYECMWNGIEDIYITKTGETIPNGFFFALSGFGNFVYLKSKTGELKRMPFFGDGRTKKMYAFLKDIVRFDYRYTEGASFPYMLKKAKAEIDGGHPVVVGALDMYELEYYPKLYHKMHVPIHYVLMTGYDDEKELVYVLDCGREDIQAISYGSLERALDIEPTPLFKNNSICIVRMEHPRDKHAIVRDALKKKAEAFLNPPISSLGIEGFKKFASEFPEWESELNAEDYRKCLMNIAMFTGTVPAMPNRLAGINAPDGIPRMACRERLCEVMTVLGCEYDNIDMTKSGEAFYESGKLIAAFADIVIDYLSGVNDRRGQAGTLLSEAAELEKTANEYMLKSVSE
jgi:hypothetical protein